MKKTIISLVLLLSLMNASCKKTTIKIPNDPLPARLDYVQNLA